MTPASGAGGRCVNQSAVPTSASTTPTPPHTWPHPKAFPSARAAPATRANASSGDHLKNRAQSRRQPEKAIQARQRFKPSPDRRRERDTERGGQSNRGQPEQPRHGDDRMHPEVCADAEHCPEGQGHCAGEQGEAEPPEKAAQAASRWFHFTDSRRVVIISRTAATI